MDPRKLFFDTRCLSGCAYCGAPPETRDHVPARVFLDQPYPDDLGVVGCCLSCNAGASQAEQYLACLLECIVHGSAEPDSRFREVVRRTSLARPGLLAKIADERTSDHLWQPDYDLLNPLIVKLARGHIAHELALALYEDPQYFLVKPLPLMDSEEREEFFRIRHSGLWPEIGSYAFVSSSYGRPSGFEQWRSVQPDRYAYSLGQAEGTWVKLIIRDYLACLVVWD